MSNLNYYLPNNYLSFIIRYGIILSILIWFSLIVYRFTKKWIDNIRKINNIPGIPTIPALFFLGNFSILGRDILNFERIFESKFFVFSFFFVDHFVKFKNYISYIT